jgi:carboxyl-terminal processing protease
MAAVWAACSAVACGGGLMGSVGAVLGKDNQDGRVYVRELPPDMPAARAGLKLDDEIVAIDGKPVRPMTPEEVHEALSGPLGSSVMLSAVREGASFVVTVKRGPLRAPGPPPEENAK